MACELHDNVRRDSVGEGEADEGLATGVSADKFVLGIDFIVSGAVAVAGDGVRCGEAANLAQVLESAVHLLVCDVREGLAVLEVFVLVFVQDGEGVLVKDDWKAVMGLLGGDVEDTVLNVHTVHFHDIGIAEAGESAEAEEVPGL